MALIIALFGLPVLAAEKVSLRLSWNHQFTSAGFYAAEWRGYYAEAGLKVEIKLGFTRNRERRRTEDDILKGRSEFGVAAPSVLMIRGEAASLTIIAPLGAMIDCERHWEGFGRILLNHVESDVFKSHPELRLESFADNQRANAFYAALGWTQAEPFEDGETGIAMIPLKKRRPGNPAYRTILYTFRPGRPPNL